MTIYFWFSLDNIIKYGYNFIVIICSILLFLGNRLLFGAKFIQE